MWEEAIIPSFEAPRLHLLEGLRKTEIRIEFLLNKSEELLLERALTIQQ
jgi:hypothetical protein